MDPGDELRLREIQREYLDFLDDDVIITLFYCFFLNKYLVNFWFKIEKKMQQDQGFYSGKVKDMISENRHRLIVNINDLRRKKSQRAKALVDFK